MGWHENLRAAGYSESGIKVYRRDELTCVYCGVDGYGDYGAFRQLTLDHVIPRKHPSWQQGDDKDHNNLVVSCYRCNSLKLEKLPDKVDVPELHRLGARERAKRIAHWVRRLAERDRGPWECFRAGVDEERGAEGRSEAAAL